jgi:hypothetical protein
MKHLSAALACRMDMQYGRGQAAPTCSDPSSLDMRYGMQHGHEAWTCSIDLEHGHAAWACCVVKQHGRAALRPGHAACIPQRNILNSTQQWSVQSIVHPIQVREI